jgi:uncharacterized protein (DUF1330 family)
MAAYWVARSRIVDPVEFKKYTHLVPGILAKYGRMVLARGGRFQIMEGPDKFHRFVVIEFPHLRARRRLLHIAVVRGGGSVPAQRRRRGRDGDRRGRRGYAALRRPAPASLLGAHASLARSRGLRIPSGKR